MKSISQLARTRPSRRVLLILLLGLFTCIGAAVKFMPHRRIVQASPNFLVTTDKAQYAANETTITTITGAAPNTPIYWQNEIDGGNVTDIYQYGQTDGSGSWTRVIENHGQYGQGVWRFLVRIGTVAKYTGTFIVGAQPQFTTSCRDCTRNSGVTFYLSGFPPNTTINWTTTWNGAPYPKASGPYGATDQNGSYTYVSGDMSGYWDTGQFVRQVDVGYAHMAVEISLDNPYAEVGSLRWYALNAKAAGKTSIETTTTAEGDNDYYSITLCEAMQKYSLIYGKMREYQVQVRDDDILTWVRVEVSEIMRNHPFLGDYSAYPTPPPEIQSNVGANDVLVFYRGGSTVIDGVTVKVTQQHDPQKNFREIFYEASTAPDNAGVVLIMDWDQNHHIGDLPLFDKSEGAVFLVDTVHQIWDISQLSDYDTFMVNWLYYNLTGQPEITDTTLSTLRQWLAANPGC